MTINAIDFFSGCGGTSLGLKQAGITPLLGIDINQDACLTYKYNLPDTDILCEDIKNIKPEDLKKYIEKRKPLLFSGCAPCQPFSRQNKNKINSDERASLLNEFFKFISFWLPDYILIENVPGMQKGVMHNQIFKDFVIKIKKLGYYPKFDVLPALNYGVPQSRKRLVLVASKFEDYELPAPTHGIGLTPFSVVKDWIYDLPPISSGVTHSDDPDHEASKLSPINLERISLTPEGKGRETWPERLRLPCHKNYKGHTDVYGRMSWNRPASGLTTKCISYSNGRYGHPEQDRAISVREAACLQTFPRNYRFFGTKNSKAKQIGNAVPPLMSFAIAKSIIEHYNKKIEKSDN